MHNEELFRFAIDVARVTTTIISILFRPATCRKSRRSVQV
ncbi:unnamed protein product [Tenebrio molitor]|nr:unnamed protein product [Tenebrio molitor]